jgi:hypothetical protein
MIRRLPAAPGVADGHEEAAFLGVVMDALIQLNARIGGQPER